MNPTFKFSFSFSAFPQIKPLVLSFHGIAALNLLYEITATLLIPNLEMDGTSMEELISSPAELKVKSSVTRPKSQEAQPGAAAGGGKSFS